MSDRKQPDPGGRIAAKAVVQTLAGDGCRMLIAEESFLDSPEPQRI